MEHLRATRCQDPGPGMEEMKLTQLVRKFDEHPLHAYGCEKFSRKCNIRLTISRGPPHEPDPLNITTTFEGHCGRRLRPPRQVSRGGDHNISATYLSVCGEGGRGGRSKSGLLPLAPEKMVVPLCGLLCGHVRWLLHRLSRWPLQMAVTVTQDHIEFSVKRSIEYPTQYPIEGLLECSFECSTVSQSHAGWAQEVTATWCSLRGWIGGCHRQRDSAAKRYNLSLPIPAAPYLKAPLGWRGLAAMVRSVGTATGPQWAKTLLKRHDQQYGSHG